MEITIEAPKVKKEEKTFTKENGLWIIHPYQKQSEIIKSYKELNVSEVKCKFMEEFVVNSNHIGMSPISFEETKLKEILVNGLFGLFTNKVTKSTDNITKTLHNFGLYPKIEIVKIVNHIFIAGENNVPYYFRYNNELFFLLKTEYLKRNFLSKNEIGPKSIVADGGIILDLVNKN